MGNIPIRPGPPLPPPSTCDVETCRKVRRDDRPLCNTHIRHVGPQVLERYWIRARAVRRNPNSHDAANRLTDVVDLMIINATTYDHIRGTGQRPAWIPERETWVNPRDRAKTILTAWIAKHAFGRDPTNDRDVIDRIATELYPREDT